MRIGWISAAPYATTGYGTQTKEIVGRLIKAGFDIECIGGIGGETVWGGIREYTTEEGIKIPCRQTMGHLGGRDVADVYIARDKLDLIITLWDCFAIEYTGNLAVPAINYIPIDAPFTPKMYKYVKDAYRIVAYSEFGYNELLKFFPPAKIALIKHGIDTEVYKPFSVSENKKTREKRMSGLPEDAFVFLCVGANVGERKQLPLLLKNFKKIIDKYDDAYLYLFSNPVVAYPRGNDLLGLADQFGVRDRLYYPPVDPILEPWSNEDMAKLYSCADCYVTPTIGEGFGLPILESMACGTPVIGTDCSAVTELVKDNGWLVKTVSSDIYEFIPVWIPTNQVYPVPNMKHLVECMCDAYENRDKLEEYGRKSREFALTYDWNKIIPKWISFLKEVEDEFALFKEIIM